jgi:hypothetical protein
MKEKALDEEMKKKYGTERGSREIIIKRISDAMTRMATKIMACKLLRKCRKEEVPAGVVASCNTVCGGNHTQLGPVFVESIPGRLQGRAGPGDKISLFMATHPDHLDRMEGA